MHRIWALHRGLSDERSEFLVQRQRVVNWAAGTKGDRLVKMQSVKTAVDKTMLQVVTNLDRVFQRWCFKRQEWPVVSGQYYVGRKDSSVAVCTLGSVDLMKKIGSREDIAIVGKTFTENLGIEKMIRNLVTNPSIRLLVLCGKESPHRVGQSIIALKVNGVDDKGQIVGSRGVLPIIKNIRRDEIERFRNQVEIIDLIGCDMLDKVLKAVGEANERNVAAFEGIPLSVSQENNRVEHVACWHRESLDYKEDQAGFFVIQVDSTLGKIVVEHYSTEFGIQRVLYGKNALEVYSTIIRNGWVTTLGHAAYLGRELAKAELALKRGLMYEQNKELMGR
jgi:tetrahydromethanopterin S-methyltransferase subunit A